VSVNQRRGTGFTLVEVLVAMALLALMGIIAWRGLDHVIAQRARVDADTAQTGRVLRTLAQIERDLTQRVPDALFAGRYGGGGVLPLALQFAADDEGRERISVLRMQPGTREARTVVYAVEDSQLVRHLADASGKRDIDRVKMLDAVHSLEIRVLVDGQWTAPLLLDAVAGGVHATAIRFTIERNGGAQYVQVLQI
jgi:general secretion pathway protein J